MLAVHHEPYRTSGNSFERQILYQGAKNHMADWYEFSIEGKKNLKVHRFGGGLATET